MHIECDDMSLSRSTPLTEGGTVFSFSGGIANGMIWVQYFDKTLLES
ncbi:MAG: hypothetical protein ABJZ55_13255 [Fuerstiella sp.]